MARIGHPPQPQVTAQDIVDRVSISAVWEALGGGELRWGRGKAFWRDGNGYNISLNDQKNCWYDFITGEGGGVLGLIKHVRGGTPKEDLHWLADFAGVVLNDHPLSRAERRKHAVNRLVARDLA